MEKQQLFSRTPIGLLLWQIFTNNLEEISPTNSRPI
jgi:hypothetical protein